MLQQSERKLSSGSIENRIILGSKNGIEWKLISANSQHQNSGPEIMVKLTNGAMKLLLQELGSNVVTINELNTILIKAANLINLRLIGVKPIKDSDSSFLNQILIFWVKQRCNRC